MKFSIEKEESHVVIISHLEKIDSLSSPDLKSEILYLIKSGERNIIVDLENTRYIDSSGLSALLTGNRLCKEIDGTFVICTLQQGVERLVQISQLDSVFNIMPTRNESIDYVMMEDIEREVAKKRLDE